MTTYTIQANSQESQATPVLQRGEIILQTTVPIFYMIAEWPVATSEKCAVLRAGETLKITLQTRCNRLAVLAVNNTGTVTVTEKLVKTRASCAS